MNSLRTLLLDSLNDEGGPGDAAAFGFGQEPRPHILRGAQGDGRVFGLVPVGHGSGGLHAAADHDAYGAGRGGGGLRHPALGRQFLDLRAVLAAGAEPDFLGRSAAVANFGGGLSAFAGGHFRSPSLCGITTLAGGITTCQAKHRGR